MEKDRKEELMGIISGCDIEKISTSISLEPIVFIIDDNPVIREQLKKANFIAFSPRELSHDAVKNMQTWPEDNKNAYDVSKLPSRLMIVNPAQEQKNKFLASTIINFYNQKTINYNIFDIPSSEKSKIPAFHGGGELEDLLAKVGFIVQKSDAGNTITVCGEGFTLTVDVTKGEITKIVEGSKEDDEKNANSSQKRLPESSFKKMYYSAKKRIGDARKFLESLCGKSQR